MNNHIFALLFAAVIPLVSSSSASAALHARNLLLIAVMCLDLFANPLARGAIVSAPQPQTIAGATYHQGTGEFWISLGTNVQLAGIEAPGGIIKTNLSPSLGAKLPDQYTSSVLAYFDFSGPSLPTGIFSQGLILPAGLPIVGTGQRATIDAVGFSAQSGGLDIVFTIDVIPAVPEPGTVGLLACGIPLACRRSRRHR